MTKKASLLTAAALAGALYLAASPFLAVRSLQTAIEQRDSEALEDRIDFPALRENLKEQLNAFMIARATEEQGGSPLGALAVGLASRFADGMVDSFVTPAGLAQAMSGEKMATRASGPGGAAERADGELFRDARYSYHSLDRFSVWLPNASGGETRLVLKRRGLSWKLTNIALPLDEL
jgi:hypothetical protein